MTNSLLTVLILGFFVGCVIGMIHAGIVEAEDKKKDSSHKFDVSRFMGMALGYGFGIVIVLLAGTFFGRILLG